MTDQLPSWRDGSPRASLLDFLEASGEIDPNHRIAVFDNDGTLWCEKPNYTQLDFMVREATAAVANDPSLRDRPEFAAVADRDMETIHELGTMHVLSALVDIWAGMTPEAFDDHVRDYFSKALHDTGVPIKHVRYRPMLELIDALRAHGFTVCVVSGGGAEFVRAISEDFYGVAPERVVGSQIAYEFTRSGGVPHLVRTNNLMGDANEGGAKLDAIQRVLGRRPVFAAGNSPGDAEMMEWATSGDGPSLALLVSHDDAEREYSYESVAATFASDETILEQAARLNWTVASIRNDWDTVFAGE